MNFSASDSILIATNASLKLYVGSGSASLPNVINNGSPDHFAYYGLPTKHSKSHCMRSVEQKLSDAVAIAGGSR